MVTAWMGEKHFDIDIIDATHSFGIWFTAASGLELVRYQTNSITATSLYIIVVLKIYPCISHHYTIRMKTAGYDTH